MTTAYYRNYYPAFDDVRSIKTFRTISDGIRSGRVDPRVVSAAYSASEDEHDVRCQQLDLLNARVEIMLDLADDFREIDRKDCQRQLVKVLKENLPAIIKKNT